MIHLALPSAACPGLHWKPLDASICLGGRRGDSKQNNDVLCTPFDDHFNGFCDVVVLYHAHCLIEVVKGFHKSH